MRKIAVALALGSLFALLIVLMRSAPLGDQNVEIDPQYLMLTCVESVGCSAAFYDETLEKKVRFNAADLYVMNRRWDEQWREDHNSFEPFSVANLYLFVAPEVPEAIESYNSFVRELLASDPDNQDLYELVFAITWEYWSATESPSILPTLDMLYADGVDRAKEAGFDAKQRYRSDVTTGEMFEDPYDCNGLAEQITILAILGDTIHARDRGLWQMHAGDVSLACSSCQGQPSGSYNPALAWAFYEQAGLEEDARVTALSLGHTSLAAALMIDIDGLNLCQQQFLLDLQAEQSSAELIDDAIIWLFQGGMKVDRVLELLEASAQAAEGRGRPDVGAVIRSRIERAHTVPRPETVPSYGQRKSDYIDL